MARQGLTPQTVPDDAYNATTWDGNLEVPTKNAVRDKIETMGGGGDVVGPASATDSAIALFDGTTGKLIKDSSVSIAPSGVSTVLISTPQAMIISSEDTMTLNVDSTNYVSINPLFGTQVNDLVALGAAPKMDAISERTAAAGVTIDGVLLKDNFIAAAAVPTLNQNTTGSAATLTTSRTFQTNLASTSAAGFNGSANNSHGVTGNLPVTNGGTGRATGTTAYSLVATGTTATGAQQTLANGATTEVLVGGGASALPVWTTATGSGAPVRATSPTITSPVINTSISGTAFLDEDDMASNSATKVASQQSIKAYVDDSMPIGAGMDYWGTTVPSTNWMFANGQAISRTTYATLFARLGTAYGTGDGSTTFNLPDKRGRVTAGKDDMGGTSANRLTNQSGGLNGDVLGATGGAETHTLTATEIPAHTHYNPANVVGTDVGSGSTFPAGGDNVIGDKGSGLYGARNSLTGSTGGGGAHNNVQPTIIANYIIKVA